jgi:GxxExxY protein
MRINDITGTIIETSIEVHRRLGPGLLETVYRKVLAYELRKKGFEVEEEWPIPVEWDELKLEIGFRADLLVNGVVVVEIKSVEKIATVFKKILLTYLRISDKRVGLLINFGEEVLKNGIHRIANNYVEESTSEVALTSSIEIRSQHSASTAPLRETALSNRK